MSKHFENQTTQYVSDPSIICGYFQIIQLMKQKLPLHIDPCIRKHFN